MRPASRFPASIVIKPDPVATSSTHPLKGCSNVTRKRKNSATMDTNSPQLFLILRDIKYQYCLYRICEPENNHESTISLNLGKPLLKMDKSTYPDSMSFVALGTRIYMVGGSVYCGHDHYAPSNKVFICDTASEDIVPGPNLVYGQVQPVLLTIGSKIYALSYRIFRRGGYRECKPGFQVLDTENPERGWSLLPVPPVRFRGDINMHSVVAYAAVDNKVVGGCSSAIFISLSEDAGTYAFDVDNKVWDRVSRVSLPFSDYAMPMPMPMPQPPNLPSLYCALSKKSDRISAFRFWYNNANNCKFRVDEIKIHNSSVLSRELRPSLHFDWPLTVVGPFGRVYSIKIGVDGDDTVNYPTNAKRYVKVNAAQVYEVDPRNCKEKMKRPTRIHEKEKDENVSLKRCRTTTKLIQNNQVEDGGEFKMSKRWSSSIFGGPMADICESISAAAFAL